MYSEDMYEDKAVYKARVSDQNVLRKKDGTPAVILNMEIVSKLKNARNPKVGTVEIPKQAQVGHEVWLNLVPGEKAEGCFRSLRSLGFEGHDYTRLHPDHPDFQSLVGRETFLKASWTLDRKAEQVPGKPPVMKLWWNFTELKDSKQALEDLKKDFTESEDLYKSYVS